MGKSKKIFIALLTILLIILVMVVPPTSARPMSTKMRISMSKSTRTRRTREAQMTKFCGDNEKIKSEASSVVRYKIMRALKMKYCMEIVKNKVAKKQMGGIETRRQDLDDGGNVESIAENINEEDIGEFNERPIKDDDLHSIVGSDSDKESEFCDSNEEHRMKDPALCKGMKFTNGHVLRTALREWVVRRG
ncbi:hypothetical protein GH714_018289 [Hevea brasiliensis]|uniref:Uncharacterized protein n=1 Tax=Hevea brasiliensis TaxID=3981 RepID=A0A6A6MEU5_HEVBR|nr:hypothetical protein GH714_018289 [Hevea brasiliensis]